MRALGPGQRTNLGSIPVWQQTREGGPVLVFRTGVGAERATAATGAVLDRFHITALINTGCAGALATHLRRGSLVIPDLVIGMTEPDPQPYPTSQEWTQRLREAAATAGLRPDPGRIATTSAALSTVSAKRHAHRQSGAVAVEMEGSAVAQVASARGLAFASARVILDHANMDLPPLDAFANPEGVVRAVKAAMRVVQHPAWLGRFLALASAARSVDKTLERLFGALFARRP